jgi:2-dehydro-3-deoxygalactonokinase
LTAASFIAGDWGTSRLRLVLCDADGAALEHRDGPGAAAVAGRFAETFDALTESWRNVHGELPAVLCGMVGSSLGWAATPYVACPVTPERIASASLELRAGRVRIVPGVSCRNRFDAPDFMRGEETQILGALSLAPRLRSGRWLLCHPGTHTKWVILDQGEIRDALSAPSGEVYAVLRDHSVLVRRTPASPAGLDAAAFETALAQFNRFPRAQLLHRLFECRSRQLAGELSAAGADAYLSGLLIASDVHGALQLSGDSIDPESIFLIGAPQLTRLYALALAAHGHHPSHLDGDAAALAGLAAIYRQLFRSEAAHVH